MFATTTKVGFAQRVVATLVASATLLWSIGYYTTAQAANLTTISNTLTDSDLSATAGHTIAFTVPTGSAIAPASEIDITFPSDLGSGFTDVNTAIQANFSATSNGSANVIDTYSVLGQVVTLSLTDAVAAGEEVVITLVEGIVTNPDAAGSTEFTVSTTEGDTGKTRVAIIDNVLVTAIVETAFDFTISGVATSTAVNGTSTTGTSEPTLIDFGVLTASEQKSLAQRLNVTTNARNGFVVTVQSDGDLQSSTGAVIDNFLEGSDVATPGTQWVSPVPTINDETSWGHWGLTTSDSNIGSLGGTIYGGFDFATNDFIAASTSAREVFHHDGPSDGITADIGSTTVLYQIEITALQEAADDYNTTLTYIATPVF
jgi:hypothetical protein